MENEVSNVILGIAGKTEIFELKVGRFKFTFKIKPLTAKQIIEISGVVSKIKSIDGEKEVFTALVENAADLRRIAKVIAIATGTRYRMIITRSILKLDLEDIEKLMGVVKRQCDIERFFFILIGMKGMNQIKNQQEEQ